MNRVGIEIVVASFVIHGVHFLDLFTLKWALIDVHFLNLFNMDSWSIQLAKFLVLLDCITNSLRALFQVLWREVKVSQFPLLENVSNKVIFVIIFASVFLELSSLPIR